MPEFPKHWVIRNTDLHDAENTGQRLEALSEVIKSELNLSSVTAKLLVSRGITEAKEAEQFLFSSLKSLPDPFLLKDMDKAVKLAGDAIMSGKKITVWGDYDVDGTTGAALLTGFLNELGVNVNAYQPSRSTEGYGINPVGIEKLFNEKTELVISVDCGITSFEAALKARELGLKLLITDHHRPKDTLPEADVIVNPNRKDDESGLGVLAGVGVGFYLAVALRKTLREQGYFENRNEPNLRELLDLVAVGTIADVASLTGVNRILVKEGLKVLENTKKVGLRALMDKAQVSAPISPYHIAFQLGPRINAAGRVGSPEIAYRLLTTKEPSLAASLASELEALNSKRRGLQDNVWSEIKSEIENMENLEELRAIVVASEQWHEGVVGIVASKIVERFSRPSVVITIPDEGPAKGSVRTFGKIPILEVIESCSEHLIEFGGHAAAAGVTIERDKIEDFRNALNSELRKFDEACFRKDVLGDLEVELTELSNKTVIEMDLLGPFGQGNPEPVFFCSGRSEKALLLKGKHMKLKVSPDHSSGGKGVDAIGFNLGETRKLPSEGDAVRLAFTPQLNRWAGKNTLQLSIKDIDA